MRWIGEERRSSLASCSIMYDFLPRRVVVFFFLLLVILSVECYYVYATLIAADSGSQEKLVTLLVGSS